MDSKERFSSRVDAYVKYRPSYPPEAISYLYDTVGFGAEDEIADIGAGTGIFSKLLLARGSSVIAVEPNQAMREAAVLDLGHHAHYRAVSGSAEATGLPDRSVNHIVCAQSFHWFDRGAARSEFSRILKPGGKAVLIWNTRLLKGTPFLEEYEQLLLAYGTDYEKLRHKNISADALASFFKPGGLRVARFSMRQLLNLEELGGRLQSSSYAPQAGHPNFEPMMAELKSIFARNEQNGVVSFEYETELYWGEVQDEVQQA
ncbi:MAG: class I SAM-dependent methyltransferase [Paenibacillus dendritiformis]|uniref:class I SAM-dependent methyltransferase n=1 Tax=uncultured Paenibacillus sp. TaxID=227322 RepID=UPI0025DF1E04|nr:class I SAM-dependent methyltransferase [uncultured Paenibacillus sp.]MDU5140894.1 class I SAM-dependent methyltransferase [Paenibacillus dendritiformis]